MEGEAGAELPCHDPFHVFFGSSQKMGTDPRHRSQPLEGILSLWASLPSSPVGLHPAAIPDSRPHFKPFLNWAKLGRKSSLARAKSALGTESKSRK